MHEPLQVEIVVRAGEQLPEGTVDLNAPDVFAFYNAQVTLILTVTPTLTLPRKRPRRPCLLRRACDRCALALDALTRNPNPSPDPDPNQAASTISLSMRCAAAPFTFADVTHASLEDFWRVLALPLPLPHPHLHLNPHLDP